MRARHWNLFPRDVAVLMFAITAILRATSDHQWCRSYSRAVLGCCHTTQVKGFLAYHALRVFLGGRVCGILSDVIASTHATPSVLILNTLSNPSPLPPLPQVAPPCENPQDGYGSVHAWRYRLPQGNSAGKVKVINNADDQCNTPAWLFMHSHTVWVAYLLWDAHCLCPDEAVGI